MNGEEPIGHRVVPLETRAVGNSAEVIGISPAKFGSSPSVWILAAGHFRWHERRPHTGWHGGIALAWATDEVPACEPVGTLSLIMSVTFAPLC